MGGGYIGVYSDILEVYRRYIGGILRVYKDILGRYSFWGTGGSSKPDTIML